MGVKEEETRQKQDREGATALVQAGREVSTQRVEKRGQVRGTGIGSLYLWGWKSH